MKINLNPLTSWLLAGAVAVVLGLPAPAVRAGELQIQSNPVSFGSVYWGNPTNWDALGIPHFQPNPPGGGTASHSINFISVAHDNYYFYVRINFNASPTFNGSDFYMWLDTDLNPATGTRDFSGTGAIGSEFVLDGGAIIQNPSVWNFVSWISWDQYPSIGGNIARDVVVSLDRTTMLPGVKSFYFTYEHYDSSTSTVGDWYPESADTLNGDYFEYTTEAVPPLAPTASSPKYGALMAEAAPLAYYRLSETNVTVDVATNSGSIGADGNGVYTTGALHPVAGAIVGDSGTAANFSAVNASSEDGAVPVIVPWPEQPMIRELWDGLAGGNLNGKGDGPSSMGFASGSTWQVNNGRIMKVTPWSDLNTPPGPPFNRGQTGQLYADNGDPGGLSSVWDTSAWATRQLASATQINFAANGDYWITVRVDNGGDTAMGVGLANGGDGTAQFIGVGAMWNTAGGGSANNSVYITDGTLGSDSPYAIRANSSAGLINGPGLIVAHLTTSATGDGTLQATAFFPGDIVPADPSGIAWQATYSFNNTMTATHLVAWLNGDTSVGNGYLDAIRVTTNYAAMFQGEMNPAGAFTVEAWLRPTVNGNAGNAQSPLQNKDPNDVSPNRVGWDFFQRDASVGYNFRMFNGNAHNKIFDLTGGAYTVGQWGHLVAVYDAVAGSATLYFDGVQVAQSTTPNGTFAPNGTFPLSIGGYADASQNPFIGDMGEVAVYTNALSPAQVLAHYQNGTNASRSSAYKSVVLADGAAEYLRLGDPARDVAHNSGTLGTNADGAYNFYTVAGHAGPHAPGDAGFEASNTAAYFNGGSSFIELRNPAALNFFGQITLEAWVQPSVTPASPGGYGDIIAHGYDEDYNEVALRVDASSGTQQYAISTYTQWFGEGASAPVPTNDLGAGAWVHLVGTFDGANWNLYRNGALLASAPDTTGSLTVTNGNWAIGVRGRWAHMDVLTPGLSRQFLGAIDEPAIYNRALTPAEVLAHYLVGASNGPVLNINPSGGSVILTWPVGTLQQADNVSGPYSDLPSATSPYSPTSGTKKFYRLKL